MSDEAATPEASAPLGHWLFLSPHDEYVWTRLRGVSDLLTGLVEETSGRIPNVESLMADLFGAFYRDYVEWNDEAGVDPVVALHRPMLERILVSPTYHHLRSSTAGNIEDAVVVMDAFLRHFATGLDDELVALLDADATYQEQKGRLADEKHLLEELAASRARPRPARPGSGPKRPEELTATERKDRIAEVVEELEHLERDHRSDFSLLRARADLPLFLDEADVPGQLAAVEQALDEFRYALSAWGAEPGVAQEMSIDERMELFRRLIADEGLRRATELLGRMRYRASAEHRSRIGSPPTQFAGVRLGDDLAHLVPSEAVLMTDPVGSLEFYRRFAERELMVHFIETEAQPARGPLIVCVDESSSMSGERDEMAKALALSLCSIANTDDRHAALIEFAAAGDLRVSHFPPGETRLLEVVAALSHFFGGGTNFDAPLAAALDIVRAARGAATAESVRSETMPDLSAAPATARDETYAKADIIMITDDEGELHPDIAAQLIAEREADGARLFVICVGKSDRTFRKVAKATWPVADLLAERDDPTILPGLIDWIHR